MLWKIVVAFLGTIVALLIATSIWGNSIRGGAGAVDVALVLRSPYWWLMNAVIVGAAGWLLKHWLLVPKR